MKAKRSLEERIADADSLAAYHLGDSYMAEERGDLRRSKRLHSKYQFWADRLKLLISQVRPH
jgi:hypothetical protein